MRIIWRNFGYKRTKRKQDTENGDMLLMSHYQGHTRFPSQHLVQLVVLLSVMIKIPLF